MTRLATDEGINRISPHELLLAIMTLTQMEIAEFPATHVLSFC